MSITRRGLLKWLGIGTAAAALPELVAADALPADVVSGNGTRPEERQAITNVVRMADGTFIAVGTHGTIQMSPDGTTWTQRDDLTPQYAGGKPVGYSQG